MGLTWRRARLIGLIMAAVILVGIVYGIMRAAIEESERKSFRAATRAQAEKEALQKNLAARDALIQQLKEEQNKARDQAQRAEAALLDYEAEKKRADAAVDAIEEVNAVINREVPITAPLPQPRIPKRWIARELPPPVNAPAPAPPVVDSPAGIDPQSAGFRDIQRPLRPGVSIGNEYGTATSACCMVRDANGKRYLLTLAILLGKSEGVPVVQPAEPDGKGEVIGSVERFAGNGSLINLQPNVDFARDIPGIGALVPAVGKVSPGEKIRLVGRGPGVIQGTAAGGGRGYLIASVPDEAVNVTSVGALVLNERNELAGYVWGASKEVIIYPIEPVLARLGVELTK